MKKDPNGAYPYSGIVDCFSKSVSRGGVTSLWAGFPTFYFRIAPHTMITLLVQDALTRYANKHFWEWRRKGDDNRWLGAKYNAWKWELLSLKSSIK